MGAKHIVVFLFMTFASLSMSACGYDFEVINADDEVTSADKSDSDDEGKDLSGKASDQTKPEHEPDNQSADKQGDASQQQNAEKIDNDETHEDDGCRTVTTKCSVSCADSIVNDKCSAKCEDGKCCQTGNLSESVTEVNCCKGNDKYIYTYKGNECDKPTHYGCFASLDNLSKICWKKVE